MKHGMAHSPTYWSWFGMKQRCYNPNNISYKNYGAVGIRVCDRWRNSFQNFLEDMGIKPDGYTLERKDNNKGYFPENCKWATWKEQRRNSKQNLIIEYNGKSQCLMDWANEIGVNYGLLWMRLKKGWSIEETLTKKLYTRVK